MSIMPGMDAAAPDRTDTSSGLAPAPNVLPVRASSLAMFFSTSSSSPAGHFPPLRSYSAQASVVIVKPGGTGSPSELISARLAPLPPSSSFIAALPSALPPPKKYTYLVFLAICLVSPFRVSSGKPVRRGRPAISGRCAGRLAFASNRMRANEGRSLRPPGASVNGRWGPGGAGSRGN